MTNNMGLLDKEIPHFLLQRIFPTQGLNPSLLHYRWSLALQVDSLPTEPPGKSTEEKAHT